MSKSGMEGGGGASAASSVREQLTVRYLTDLMACGGIVVALREGKTVSAGLVTHIGLERPEGLHPGSQIVTVAIRAA
ncbi:hypothetical protein [Streptomyces sp. NPDC054783]